MSSHLYAENDGRFPDDAPVLVKFPIVGADYPDCDPKDRETWPWLPGHVLGQCGPNEWHVVVDGVPELGEIYPEEQDGAPLFPAAFRDASELRAVES